MNARLTEIASIWKANQWLYGVGGFILGLLAYPGANCIVTDLLALLGDLVPEAVGIVATVLIIDRISEARELKRREDELKARLVREAGSSVNMVAVQAINELHNHGWLYGKNGLLQSAKLFQANLEEANLYMTNLKEAKLGGANLKKSNLSGAQLKEANLKGTHLEGAFLLNTILQGAFLKRANLEGANLLNADLKNANLALANLEGANLFGANLQGANLNKAKFNEKKILPVERVIGEDVNGKPTLHKYWTTDTDMTCYTNPDHPSPCQPNWVRTGFDSALSWINAGAPNPDDDTDEPITNP